MQNPNISNKEAVTIDLPNRPSIAQFAKFFNLIHSNDFFTTTPFKYPTSFTN